MIQSDEQLMTLTEFRLQNDANITFAPGVTAWQVSAQRTWIGSNVRILGNGSKGADGTPGRKLGKKKTPDCVRGENGMAGQAGASGQNGVHIQMKLGLIHFESMTIQANGGAGGKGGTGGEGATGGSEDDCHAARGGDGGHGGAGGDGGLGGSIEILYWSANQESYIPVSNYGPGIHIENRGGEPGKGGAAGKGGKGGKGGWSKRGSGKLVSRDSGDSGKDGTPGHSGRAGSGGKFLIQPVAGPR